MKNWFLLLCCILLVLTVSCNSNTPIFGGFILQPNRMDLPSLNDFDAVELNKTTAEEVQQQFGRPQYQETSGFASVTYHTEDGHKVQLFFVQNETGTFYVYDMVVISI